METIRARKQKDWFAHGIWDSSIPNTCHDSVESMMEQDNNKRRQRRAWSRWGHNQGLEHRHSLDKPWEFFPDRELPRLPSPSQQDLTLMRKKVQLTNYWKRSPYYINDENSKSAADGLQLYSDIIETRKKENREKFESYLKLNESNFSSELIQATKQKITTVKLHWD